MINCTSNISENEECKVHTPIKESELQKEVNRVHITTNTCKQDRTGEEMVLWTLTCTRLSNTIKFSATSQPPNP